MGIKNGKIPTTELTEKRLLKKKNQKTKNFDVLTFFEDLALLVKKTKLSEQGQFKFDRQTIRTFFFSFRNSRLARGKNFVFDRKRTFSLRFGFLQSFIQDNPTGRFDQKTYYKTMKELFPHASSDNTLKFDGFSFRSI